MALRSNRDERRVPVFAIYALPIGIVVVSCALNALSEAQNVSWRLGAAQNFWEPAMWEVTSGLVVVALLPLARLAASLVRPRVRPIAAWLCVAGLALVFSTLHIVGIGLLRELLYRLGGWAYAFPWSNQVPFEMRKDLLVAYPGLVLLFWLAQRFVVVGGPETRDTRPDVGERAAPSAELWLRDGRSAVLIDAAEIVWVTSAGNYVEYRLTGKRTHLIRATLQAQEDRLAPFGITRVHRTRLVNLKRIVGLQSRQSGDFEIRLDTGETIACSRRFKATVARLAG